MSTIPKIEQILKETKGAYFNFNYNRRRETWRAYMMDKNKTVFENESLLNLFDDILKFIKNKRVEKQSTRYEI